MVVHLNQNQHETSPVDVCERQQSLLEASGSRVQHTDCTVVLQREKQSRHGFWPLKTLSTGQRSPDVWSPEFAHVKETERQASTAYEGSSGTGRRAPDFVSSVESSAGIINICGVPFKAHKVVMQKAGEGYPGDTSLTKLITRNLRGKERRYLWTCRLQYWLFGVTLPEGKIFTVRGFRQVTLCRLQGVYSCWSGGCEWLKNDRKLIPCTCTTHTCTWKLFDNSATCFDLQLIIFRDTLCFKLSSVIALHYT